MSIKLIIFDFDGTLGDTRRNIVTTMQMAIKEMQLPERSEAECASTIGEPFDWLYIDADTLKEKAANNGYVAEVVAEGDHYDYLARITKMSER